MAPFFEWVIHMGPYKGKSIESVREDIRAMFKTEMDKKFGDMEKLIEGYEKTIQRLKRDNFALKRSIEIKKEEAAGPI
jgi:hypothetical protein